MGSVETLGKSRAASAIETLPAARNLSTKTLLRVSKRI